MSNQAKGTGAMSSLEIAECLDSEERAVALKRELGIAREKARSFGREITEAIRSGYYTSAMGRRVEWKDAVHDALAAKESIPPEAGVPLPTDRPFDGTMVQVVNLDTLSAARVLVDEGLEPLALNFANGVYPGGGFLSGARAQEEALCRSSALFATLEGDAMYETHRNGLRSIASAWAILSPGVPVCRDRKGSLVDDWWLLSFVTCAAPIANEVGVEESAALLDARIGRIYEIAAWKGYDSLVLGAWGCGAFGNDPVRVAESFMGRLERDHLGRFRKVVFAISDWSPERRMLGPFRDAAVQRKGLGERATDIP